MDNKYCLMFLSIFFILWSDTWSNDFRLGIKNHKQFMELATNASEASYGISSVKLVYDLQNDTLYYVNTKLFKYHYDFCHDILKDNSFISIFNDRNYRNHPERRYIFATILYHHGLKKYIVEFLAEDYIDQKYLSMVVDGIKNSFFLSYTMPTLTNSAMIIQCVDNAKVPNISPDILYGERKFQIIQEGKVTGIVKTMSSIDRNQDYRENILILKKVPIRVPLCKGIVVLGFQTPLSHVSLLARNRKIPLVAVKSLDSLKKFDDQYCLLEVAKNIFSVSKTVDSLVVAKKNTQVVKLSFNIKDSTLYKLDSLYPVQVNAIGGKAYNLAFLKQGKTRISLYTPANALAIPFYYYNSHVIKNNIDVLIRHFLKRKDKLSIKKRNAYLKKIRKGIEKGSISTRLIENLTSHVKKSNWQRVRLRSSSNAEDLPSFNGAGLYTSKTAVLGDKKKTIERALKKVWASLWTIRAFEERELYNIDHHTAFMGILVHQSFPYEIVNGVALTENFYYDGMGFSVNLQLGDVSTVSPPKGVTAEQSIIYYNRRDPFYKKKVSVQYIGYSSLTDSYPLLSEKDMDILGRTIYDIEELFYKKIRDINPNVTKEDITVDIEFKFLLYKNGSKRLLVKQARLLHGAGEDG